MATTTVAKVRKAWTMDPAEAAAITYVGNRAFGWPQTIFGNPYAWKEHGKGRAVGLFASLVGPTPGAPALGGFPPERGDPLAYRAAILAALPTLRGKALGCWCGSWRPGEPRIACHACVLAVLADGGRWDADLGDDPA